MLLDWHEVELNEEIEKEKEDKHKVIRNIKKMLGRNKYLRSMTNNVRKGTKLVSKAREKKMLAETKEYCIIIRKR